MDQENSNNENKPNLIKKNIKELNPGMKTGKNIGHKYGGILIPEGTILDQHKIKRLKNLGLMQVKIYDENENQIKNNLEKIKRVEAKYKENRTRLKSMFKKIRNNEEIEYEEVKNLTYEVTTLGNDKDMIDLLTKIRQADQYTYSHLLNVGMMAYMFGNWLNLDQEDSIKLTQAGLLHDIGKAKIPDKILNKPNKLTDKEYDKMKKHTVYGYKMALKNAEIPANTSRGILTHHERYDGTGYPLKIKGDKIPLFGRILGIVDTFDAFTADRIYQPAKSPFKAIKLFDKGTFGVFDSKLVNIFLSKIPNYFVNEEVILNDGRKAEVVFINPRHPERPIIKIDDNYIDLYKNSNIEIEKLVKKN
ncbi:MAG: HD-GYP domain-containing protein [Bacillota bacterium]